MNVKADGLKLYQKYAGTIVTDPRESVKLVKRRDQAAATTLPRKTRATVVLNAIVVVVVVGAGGTG